MFKKLISITFIIFFSNHIFSQNACSKFYVFKEGVKFEMTSYDKKDKLTSIVKYEVKNVSDNSAVLANEVLDEKGESILNSEVKLICSDDGISIDFQSLISSEILEKYKEMNMEIDMTGSNIEIPNNLSPGQNLPDAELIMTMSMSGINMKIEVNMTHRKVVKKETITTDAGTFKCVLLTNDIEMKVLGKNSIMSSKKWLAEGVGLVKSEEYDKKGNLMSKSILTKFDI